MKDFFLYPAQTNQDLYFQAISHGYSPEQLSLLADSYLFALQQVYPVIRGSGKPFVAHLVGTASLIMESGGSVNWVIAAMLHAIYQRRIPFQHGLALEDRRKVVADRFGSDVDDLVHRYTDFKPENLHQLVLSYNEFPKDVLTLRLADDLEDACGFAFALHGNRGSQEDARRGSHTKRIESLTNDKDDLLFLSEQLGLDGLRRSFLHWLDFSKIPEAFAHTRTGQLSSYNLDSNLP
jgi:hypothetical protein